MAEETVLVEVKIEQEDAQFNKLANLKGTLVGLKTEQKQLEKALKDGIITQKEYNNEIVRVEALQKRTQAQYSQTQRSVTGLKNPINELNNSIKKQNQLLLNAGPALDSMTNGAASVAQGIFGMIKASLAFIATPLGLTLSAIALVLVPVISYLKGTGEGMDKVDVATARWNARLEDLRDKLNAAGKAMTGGEGGFMDALANAIPLLKIFLVTTEEAADAAEDYASAIDDLRDAEANYGVEAARTENQIKRLMLESKNRTLSEQERIDKLNEVVNLEGKLSTQRKAFADEELSLLVERNRKRLEEVGITQKADETQATFAENNLNRIRDFDEDLAEALISSLKKIEEAAGAGIAIEEKAQNQMDALLDKAEEKKKKRAEDSAKRSEEERKQRIADFESKLAQDSIEFEAELEKHEKEVEQNKSKLDKLATDYEIFKKRIKTADEKADAESKKMNEKAADDKERLQNQALATSMQFFGRNKKASSAITLVDTYLSAQKAYASQLIPGDPTSIFRAILAAALTTASGLGRVAMINGIGFARGGYTGKGGKYEPAGIVHKGEVVWSQDDVARAGGAEAVDRMRPTYRRDLTPYATGGIVGNETRIATQQAASQVDLNQLSTLINQVQTVLILEQFEAKQNSVNQIQRRATVIE